MYPTCLKEEAPKTNKWDMKYEEIHNDITLGKRICKNLYNTYALSSQCYLKVEVYNKCIIIGRKWFISLSVRLIGIDNYPRIFLSVVFWLST